MNKSLLFLIVFLGVIDLANCQTSINLDYNKLRNQYLKLKTETERLSFCIAKINDGTIARFVPLKRLKLWFGDDFTIDRGNIDGAGVAMVYFRKQKKVKYDTADTPTIIHPLPQMGFFGWYLVVESTENGEIDDYYLSNLHK